MKKNGYDRAHQIERCVIKRERRRQRTAHQRSCPDSRFYIEFISGVKEEMLKVGQKVRRKPVTLVDVDDTFHQTQEEMTGTVVYVHPKGRFHVVEFRSKFGTVVRESFQGA